MKKYHVVKGRITDADVAAMWGKQVGDTEWQFSDGPPGQRSTSYDYPSLEVGLRELCPAVIIMETAQ